MKTNPQSTGPIVAPAPAGGPAPHLPHLDSLRGIAALLVVLHHAFLECPPSGDLAWAVSWLVHGHFMVTAFIILSGYCLALPTLRDGRLRGGLGDFARRRAVRLLPAYYVALAASLALDATLIGHPTGRHWAFALPVDRRAVLAHLVLIHNFSVSTLWRINHVFWSIAVECQIYFAFPILLLLGRRVGIVATAGLALGLGYLGYWQVGQTPRFGLMPSYYGMFALGMLAAHLGHAPAWRAATDGVSWWTISGLALLATLVMGPSQTYEVLDLPFGIGFGALLVALAGPGRARGYLSWRPLVALGGFSYSLYLIHAPLQHLLVEYGLAPLGVARGLEFPAMALVGTPLILAASYAFYRAFERPILARRVSRTGPESDAARTARPGWRRSLGGWSLPLGLAGNRWRTASSRD